LNFIKNDLGNKIGGYSFYYDLFILGQSNLEHSMRRAIEGKNLDNVDFTSAYAYWKENTQRKFI